MVLKYRTECRYPADDKEGEYAQEQWHFIDGIIGASIYYDQSNKATVAALEFESRPFMKIAIYDEAYLLNENGKTIEKVRC